MSQITLKLVPTPLPVAEWPERWVVSAWPRELPDDCWSQDALYCLELIWTATRDGWHYPERREWTRFSALPPELAIIDEKKRRVRIANDGFFEWRRRGVGDWLVRAEFWCPGWRSSWRERAQPELFAHDAAYGRAYAVTMRLLRRS